MGWGKRVLFPLKNVLGQLALEVRRRQVIVVESNELCLSPISPLKFT